MKTTANNGQPLQTTANATGTVALRLWLPGYHTPSGNDTVGKHWSKVYRMKKAVAGHLLYGLQNLQGAAEVMPPVAITNAAARVLGKIAMGVPLERRKGKKPAKPLVPARLRIERVTVALCDEDNFKGGTKGMVDCLRYAFPSVLLDDAPGYVLMEHVQTRCGKRCEEGTWIDLSAGEE